MSLVCSKQFQILAWVLPSRGLLLCFLCFLVKVQKILALSDSHYSELYLLLLNNGHSSLLISNCWFLLVRVDATFFSLIALRGFLGETLCDVKSFLFLRASLM